MSTGRTIARNFIALFAGRVATAGALLAATAILTRTLEPDEFGIYSLFFSLLAVASAFTDFGANTIATREMASGRGSAGTVLGMLLVSKALFAIVAILFVNLYILAAIPARFQVPLWLASIGFVSLVFNAFDSWFHSEGRMELSVFPRTLANLGLVGALVWLSAGGQLSFPLAVAVRIGSACAGAILIGGIGLACVRPVLRGAIGGLAAFLRMSVPVGLAASITMLYFYLDSMMLQIYRGESEVAVYQGAYRIFGFGATVAGMLLFPFFPFLSDRYARDRTGYRRLLGRAAFVLGFFCVPPALCGALLSQEIVSGFLGGGIHDYSRSAAPLVMLMGAIVAVGAGSLGSTALIVSGRQRLWVLIAASGLVLNAGLNAVVLPGHGAEGAAATTLATEAWIAVATLSAIAREGPLLRAADVGRVALIALVVGGGAFLLRGRSVWISAAVLIPGFLLMAVALGGFRRLGEDT